MNPSLRDRILRRLDSLSDERGYQVLDYVDFLESRYAEKPAPPASLLTRFAEGVEDRLRMGGVAASTVAETMGLLNRAVGVLNGVAAAGMSVATDVAAAAERMASAPAGAAAGAPAPSAPAAAAANPAAPPPSSGATGAAAPTPPAAPPPGAPGTPGV